jgi:hypothetical protein
MAPVTGLSNVQMSRDSRVATCTDARAVRDAGMVSSRPVSGRDNAQRGDDVEIVAPLQSEQRARCVAELMRGQAVLLPCRPASAGSSSAGASSADGSLLTPMESLNSLSPSPTARPTPGRRLGERIDVATWGVSVSWLVRPGLADHGSVEMGERCPRQLED